MSDAYGDRRHRPRVTSRVVLVGLMVLFVNLPLVHSTWTRVQVDRSGSDVTAEVVEHRVLRPGDDPRYWLSFRFPEAVDPQQAPWSAEVDRATYDEAVAEDTVGARVLPDRPSAYRVEGQVRRWLGLVTTLIADGILLGIILLVWRYGRRFRPRPLRMAAVADVERCPPGPALEQVEGTLYLVRGEVAAIDDEEILLDLGDREVVVALDGHRNPVGYQQPAQVRARLLE